MHLNIINICLLEKKTPSKKVGNTGYRRPSPRRLEDVQTQNIFSAIVKLFGPFGRYVLINKRFG